MRGQCRRFEDIFYIDFELQFSFVRSMNHRENSYIDSNENKNERNFL